MSAGVDSWTTGGAVRLIENGKFGYLVGTQQLSNDQPNLVAELFVLAEAKNIFLSPITVKYAEFVEVLYKGNIALLVYSCALMLNIITV